jgi:hypothetical protein
MHHHQQAERIIKAALEWAKTHANIFAVALVGSYAREQARPESDIDLVILTSEPGWFHDVTTWCYAIDWATVGARPVNWQGESYGLLWSCRLWLEDNGGEIEFGFVPPAWADVHPVGAGTRQVITDGCRILHDPQGPLKRVCAAVETGPS